MKNNELLKKSMPVSQPVSAEPLLITTTKSKRGRPRGNHFPYILFNVDDAIYEVLTMPREEITI